MLWSLMRAHQERAELARRMADQERSLNRSKLADQMAQRAKEYDEDAEVLRGLLNRGDAMTAADDREQEVA